MNTFFYWFGLTVALATTVMAVTMGTMRLLLALGPEHDDGQRFYAVIGYGSMFMMYGWPIIALVWIAFMFYKIGKSS